MLLFQGSHGGGAEYGYRLRISPPQPDFGLRVVPCTINARAGTSVPITVYALRKDGFDGDISLALKDAPEGFALSGGQVPGNQEQVRLTLTVSGTSSAEPFDLRLQGRAVIAGREVVREAVAAEGMMQVFAYRHLAPTQELKVAIAGRSGLRTVIKVLGKMPVRIPAGGTARVQFSLPRGTFFGNVKLELSDPPEGITIKEIAPARESTEIVFESDAAKAKPGLKGNLIVTASAKTSGIFGKGKSLANQRSAPLTALPAIPFEIVAP